MRFTRLAALAAALLFCAPAFAQKTQVYCIQSTSTPCNTTSNPGSGTQGDPLWLISGKVNSWGLQLGLFSNQPANEVAATPSGTTGILSVRPLVALDIPTSLADSTSINGTTVPASAGTLNANGASWSMASGFTGSYGSGHLDADQLLGDQLPTLATGWLEWTGSAWEFGSPTAAPCGSSGNIQYNNSGSCGGLATTGSGNAVLSTSPALTTPTVAGYATASLPTCNSGSKGALAYTTDGTPSFTFCNGSTWVSNGGTAFTAAGSSGCTISTTAGDATGGDFIVGTGCTPGTATVTITFNGAVGMTAGHVWVCTIYDFTLQAAGNYFGQWGPSAHSTTTVTIPIPLAASIGDEIDFECGPH